MYKALITLSSVFSILCFGASADSDEPMASQLPPCPTRGIEIVEDQDCFCTEDARKKRGNLLGSGPYHWYSNVCMAAMHAGVTGPEGGEVRIEIRPPQSSYQGTLANGAFSSDYGSSEEKSFVVLPVVAQ